MAESPFHGQKNHFLDTMNDTIDLARKLVMSRDEDGMRKLLQQWKAEGVSCSDAYEKLMVIWDELTVAANDAEIDFLSNWLDVVKGNVGPGALIWQVNPRAKP